MVNWGRAGTAAADGLTNAGNLLTRVSPEAGTAGRVVTRGAAHEGTRPGGSGSGSGSGSGGGATGETAGRPGSEAAAGGGNGAAAAPAAPSGVLATIGRGFAWMTSVEQALSAPIAAIPFPGFPALRCLDAGMGLPHAHNHPPNLVPPAPPVPFPHATMILKIPILSGATQTKIGGMDAARCGDMGAEIWCGGFFPMCEVFLGSASVWIEMSRAGRLGVDITKHCIFSTPKPSDPPLGPMVGMTMSGSMNVMIGGVPMPSLTNLAIGLAFRGVFRALGAAGRFIGARIAARVARTRLARVMERLAARRANRFVNRIMATGKVAVHGDAAFQAATRADLERLARTRAGRELLEDLANRPHRVDIISPHYVDPSGAQPFLANMNRYGPHCSGLSDNARPRVVMDPNGPLEAAYNPRGAPHIIEPDGRVYQVPPGSRVRVDSAGAGSPSNVVYDPTRRHAGHAATRGTPSDVILGHELNHARNNSLGRSGVDLGPAGGATNGTPWRRDWPNFEEQHTVGWENAYRAEQGLPPRPTYNGGLP